MFKSSALSKGYEYCMTLPHDKRIKLINKVMKYYCKHRKPVLHQFYTQGPESFPRGKNEPLTRTISVQTDNIDDQQSAIKFNWNKEQQYITITVSHSNAQALVLEHGKDVTLIDKGNGVFRVEMIRSEMDRIFKIKNSKQRRSTAWRIYQFECNKRGVRPKLKYPRGDTTDYICAYNELVE